MWLVVYVHNREIIEFHKTFSPPIKIRKGEDAEKGLLLYCKGKKIGDYNR